MNPFKSAPFNIGDYVESKGLPGAIWRILSWDRTYDGLALAKVKFQGPHRGLPPITLGRVNKHFRIKKLNMLRSNMTAPNPMLVIAVMGK